MKKRSTFSHEQKYWKSGYDFVIGVDEAGRGPLAGPVVACAATFINISRRGLEKDCKFKLIKDSKLLSKKQREELYDFVQEHFHVGIGICNHKIIDRINILEATKLAMKIAVDDLLRKPKVRNKKIVVLIDGNKTIPSCSYEQKTIIGGDNLVKSISAASIVAKVTRDRMMKKMHKKYPEYDFARHKGYGTRLHMDMIKKYGACEIHRKSFKPFH